jgi:hypothetical protein
MDEERIQEDVTDHAASPQKPRLAVKIIGTAILVLISLILSECILRLSTSNRYIRNGLRRGGIIRPYKPDSEAELHHEEFKVLYTINKFGFRDRPRSIEKKPGTKRVLLLGDSFAEGWGVAQSKTFCRLIEGSLKNMEFWNTARNGGCPVQYLFQLRDYGDRFKPDAIVIQIFDNDLIDNRILKGRLHLSGTENIGDLPVKFEARSGFVESVKKKYRGLEIKRRYRLLKLKLKGRKLLRHLFIEPGSKPDSKLMDLTKVETHKELSIDQVLNNTEHIFFYARDKQKQWQPDIDFMERVLDQIARECKQRSIRLGLIYIPDAFVYRLSKSVDNAKIPNPLRDTILKVVKRHNLSLLDMQAVTLKLESPKRFHHKFDGHYNEQGHALIAKHAKDMVQKLIQ